MLCALARPSGLSDDHFLQSRSNNALPCQVLPCWCEEAIAAPFVSQSRCGVRILEPCWTAAAIWVPKTGGEIAGPSLGRAFHLSCQPGGLKALANDPTSKTKVGNLTGRSWKTVAFTGCEIDLSQNVRAPKQVIPLVFSFKPPQSGYPQKKKRTQMANRFLLSSVMGSAELPSSSPC